MLFSATHQVSNVFVIYAQIVCKNEIYCILVNVKNQRDLLESLQLMHCRYCITKCFKLGQLLCQPDWPHQIFVWSLLNQQVSQPFCVQFGACNRGLNKNLLYNSDTVCCISSHKNINDQSIFKAICIVIQSNSLYVFPLCEL